MTRFPTYPPDILSRADALLSEKYPDGIVDPAIAILVFDAMMQERERAVEAATEMNTRLLGDDIADGINGYVAEAIRGTK